MSLITPIISFYRTTSLITDEMVRHYVAAQQIQIDRDFRPAWGSSATCVFVPRGSSLPGKSWHCVFMDRSDEAGALGYHFTTPEGQPLLRVFVGDALHYGLAWSVTASHEVLETLADPWIDNTIPITNAEGSYEYAREVCDTCEDDHFAYPINGVFMSDFALPSWFDPNGRAPFTYRGTVQAPFALASGGYIGRKKRGGQWEQVMADDGSPITARMNKGPMSRTARRFMEDQSSGVPN